MHNSLDFPMRKHLNMHLVASTKPTDGSDLLQTAPPRLHRMPVYGQAKRGGNADIVRVVVEEVVLRRSGEQDCQNVNTFI